MSSAALQGLCAICKLPWSKASEKGTDVDEAGTVFKMSDG